MMMAEISQTTLNNVEGKIFCLQAICPENILDEKQDLELKAICPCPANFGFSCP
jgi:hypothetical protein